MYYYKIR